MTYLEWKTKSKAILLESESYRATEDFWLNAELDTLASDLIGKKPRVLSASQVAILDEAVEQLAAGKPLPLITGFTWFYGARMACLPGVLIPRPDSEKLVETAFALIESRLREADLLVLDLCTGSGCLSAGLIHLARERHLPRPNILATDLSPLAIDAARINVPEAQIEQADLWPEALREGTIRPSLVMCNPPYLGASEPEVNELTSWEPIEALVAGSDGLDFYRRLIDEGSDLLPEKCYLVLEHGQSQAAAIRVLVEQNEAWEFLRTENDMAGRPRVTVLRRKGDL